MATGLGPEGCVIISMLAKIEPRVYVFNLDTGYQFRETLELRERINEKYGMDIDLQRPELIVAEYEAVHGGPVYRHDPDRCCLDRKIAVLHRVAADFDAWATGHSPRPGPHPGRHADRQLGQEIRPGEDQPPGRLDEEGRVEAASSRRSVPYNPLHDQDYPSIGCWPCTRAVQPGEDERAGRWSGTDEDRVRPAYAPPK